MKKMLLILLVLMPIFLNGQTNEFSRLDTMERDIKNIKLKLKEHSIKYSKGVTLIIAGSCLNIIGGVALGMSPENSGLGIVLCSLGSLCSLGGTLKIINSHKILRYAGIDPFTKSIAIGIGLNNIHKNRAKKFE